MPTIVVNAEHVRTLEILFRDDTPEHATDSAVAILLGQPAKGNKVRLDNGAIGIVQGTYDDGSVAVDVTW